MSMTDVRVTIEAPSRTPHRYGLFSVLDFIDTGRGQTLLAWDSIGCGPVEVAQDPCLIDTGADHTKGTTESVGCDNSGGVESLTVMAWDDSSLGRPPRQVTSDRAARLLALGEQAAVERLVSFDMLGSAADVTPLTGNPPAGASYEEKVLISLGAVEQALAGSIHGEGVILLPRILVPLMSSALSQTGSVLRTKLGTPVAACGGWDPSQTTATQIVGTAALVGSRGPVVSGQGWNTNLNDHAAYAERDYSIGWECEPVYADPITIT